MYGPVKWPPISPDLSPLDFFLCGTVKDIIYDTSSTDVNDLQRRITEACASISRTLPEATKNIIHRAEKCTFAHGSRIELATQPYQ